MKGQRNHHSGIEKVPLEQQFTHGNSENHVPQNLYTYGISLLMALFLLPI